MSNTTSIRQTKTSTIQLNVNDSSYQELVALPLFLIEVIIWAIGHITESSHTKITYNKSLIPVKFFGFRHTLKHYEEKYQYESELINHDIDKYVFQALDKKNPYINTLPSNKELTSNRYINSKSGKYSFGLLPTGELVLCRDIVNIKYSNDFIYLIDSYVNDDSTPLDDNKKDFKNKLEEYYKKNNIEKRLYIPDEGDEDDDDDNDDDFDFDKLFGDKTTIITSNTNLRSTVSTTKTTTIAKTTTTTKTSRKSTTTTKTTNTSIIPTSNNNNSNSIVVVSNKYCNKYNNDGAFGWYEIDDDEKCIIVNKEKAEKIINSIISTTPQKTSTSQATSTTVNEPTIYLNVVFPDDKGYYLYIDDHVDSRRGARVTLYYGVGVKIWEIYGKQDNYYGYAFQVEYLYPLSIDTTIPFKDEEYYDKHNILNQAIVKDLNTDQIEMNCKNILKENEALVSKNKKYRFFVQKTGNMVIKENSRTTWSSMTANIEIFEGPYHLALSKLYGSLSFCDYFISNNKTCNKMYSYNHRIIGSSLPNGNDKHTLYLHFYNNTLDYINFNENTVSYFDINEYAKIKETIYLLSITDKGNIELNNGEYILHKEYYKADEYYYLYVSNDNLILRSSTGEYKWAANKTISNRPYDASEIGVGDSFKEGEMLYCGDYSVTILNDKLQRS
ncbi:hypothetical protein H8356DRAFT_1404565 [Neocallimastix lanati (nom. inval.)]|nr:hypothetical protein H8356DRAFT_1404565 [Neocallimastix sp. JGI-2020a]